LFKSFRWAPVYFLPYRLAFSNQKLGYRISSCSNLANGNACKKTFVCGYITGTTEGQEPGYMARTNNWNENVVREFRENGGRVGGRFEGRPLLLLHHTGARTQKQRVNPLAYQRLDDGSWAVFGSKGGAPTNPDWYYNLIANPRAAIEVGTERFEVNARVAEGDERERIWEKQKRDMPGFADYEHKTSRPIPVVILERVRQQP
jgi:deazaflavin-dependent oxidoreductase (nitroreductase family)